MDLLATEQHFGLVTLSYTVSAWAIFRFRRTLFADNLSTLPLMIVLFSILSGITHLILFDLFHGYVSISAKWVAIDLVVYPMLDAVVGTALFLLPAYLLGKRPKRGHEYFSEESTA